MLRFPILVLALALSAAPVLAGDEGVALNPDHPQRYTVVRGDTLWHIAGRFLRNPWDWPKLWRANPDIKNPDLIYPGDTIVLGYDGGRPYLALRRGGDPGTASAEKLQPQVRTTPIERAVPIIHYETIRPFLTSPKVVSQAEIDAAPYVVSLTSNRLIGGTGDTIYVRGLPADARTAAYTVFRPDSPLKDPETKADLGYDALYIADSRLVAPGDPATLRIKRSVREVLVGDRLLPVTEEQLALDYFPHPAPKHVRGRILKVLDGVSRIGQYNIVAVSAGRADGLEKGHVLKVWRHGDKVFDNVVQRRGEWLTLPDTEAGWILIFRPFERVSYGIVMKAVQAIRIGDLVTSPEL